MHMPKNDFPHGILLTSRLIVQKFSPNGGQRNLKFSGTVEFLKL